MTEITKDQLKFRSSTPTVSTSKILKQNEKTINLRDFFKENTIFCNIIFIMYEINISFKRVNMPTRTKLFIIFLRI